MRLKGKTIIITGAGPGRGMSRGFPEAFAKEGAALSLNYFGYEREEMERFKSELEGYGIPVVLTEGDISSECTARLLVENTVTAFGKIDVLVNNAGITGPKSITELSVADWDRMLNVNLRSVFLTCKFVVPHMIARNYGRIINIASQIGQKGGVDHCHYAAAKAGMIGFTKSLALELGQYGINANCIAPGPIDTQLMDEVDESWRKSKLAELPLGRFGKIEEVVPTAIFLASSPAGDLYTGQTLGPNSGDVML